MNTLNTKNTTNTLYTSDTPAPANQDGETLSARTLYCNRIYTSRAEGAFCFSVFSMPLYPIKCEFSSVLCIPDSFAFIVSFLPCLSDFCCDIPFVVSCVLPRPRSTMSNTSTYHPSLDDPNVFVLYRYHPTRAGAIIFIIAFSLATALHGYQIVSHRTWYFLPLLVGGICKPPPVFTYLPPPPPSPCAIIIIFKKIFGTDHGWRG